MKFRFILGLTLFAATPFAFAAPAEARLLAPTQSASTRAVHASVIAIGKVVELEKDTVEGPAFPGAPKDQKANFKIAVLKIEDALLGAKGLTQIRIGFMADLAGAAPPPAVGGGPVAARPVRVGGGPVALTTGMEGCYLLEPLPGADFYIVSGNGPPLAKKDENYEKELKAIQTMVRTFEEPVKALKAKEFDDRFFAAYVLLQRYQLAKGDQSRVVRESIPDEENKLLLSVLVELPWLPKDPTVPGPAGGPPPSRSAIWHLMNWNEYKFTQPKAAPGADYNKLMDDATTAFLKENVDKLKLKRKVVR